VTKLIADFAILRARQKMFRLIYSTKLHTVDLRFNHVLCVCVCVRARARAFSCVHGLQHFSVLNLLNMGSNSGANDSMQSSEIINARGQTDGWRDGRIFVG
jgi:hypothetical protein